MSTEENKVNLSNKYACEQFKIDTEQYGPDNSFKFRTRIITIGTDSLELGRLTKNLDEFGRQLKFSFGIVKIESSLPCTNVRSSYNSLLENNYMPGFITIIIVCDEIRFLEEGNNRVDGAALGIPTLEDPTAGKPIIFIRKSSAYTKVLHHELGHVFALSHTFKDYDTYKKGLTCDTRYGDGQPDTVTPLRMGSVGEKSCDYYAPEAALKDYSKEEISNMVANIMSYSPSSCMQSFTESQIQKMRKIVELNGRLQDCIM